MFKIRTLRKLHSKLENDRNVADKIRTIGRVKSFKNDEKVLILQDLKDGSLEIKATLRGTSEVKGDKLRGSIARVLLTSANVKTEEPKFSVYSLKVINSFERKQYHKLLREERKINRLLGGGE